MLVPFAFRCFCLFVCLGFFVLTFSAKWNHSRDLGVLRVFFLERCMLFLAVLETNYPKVLNGGI